MNVRRSIPSTSLGLFAALVAAGCAVDPGDASTADGTPGEDQAEMLASCTSPSRYFVSLRSGATCPEILGRRGRWIPEAGPVFSDAPKEIQKSSCVLAWHGDRSSPPDQDALFRALTERHAVAPACGSSSGVVPVVVQSITHIDNLGHAGSVGCDVCGITRRGKVWTVLPPERVHLRQFAVKLTNGEERAFQIRGEASAMSMTLPPPPEGTAYVDGPVVVF